MIDQTIAAFEFLAEEARKKRSMVMFPTSMKVIGVRAPNINKVANACWEAYKNNSADELLEFAKKLVKTNILECNLLAFELLWKNKKALRLVRLKDIEELGQNIGNWVAVDTLSVKIAGWAWREKQISDDDVLSWLKSNNRWWRRKIFSSVS